MSDCSCQEFSTQEGFKQSKSIFVLFKNHNMFPSFEIKALKSESF